MKPLKLVINAFGPYVDKTEIDFEQFGNSGLYLIAGETGSGKTTIFDAISFALFGEASGNIRNNTLSLRSDFADENNKTYVELEFLNHGEKYYIKRFCSYRKEGRKAPVSETVEFIKPDNTVISNLNEANKEIQDIIGVDKNQFAQIVMIAQGEFRRFLLAPTKEKEKIFRKIFQTQLYQTFQIRLGEMFKAKESEKKNVELLITKDIENIISDSIKLDDIRNEKNAICNLDELLNVLEEYVNEDRKTNDASAKEEKELQEEILKLTKTIEQGKAILKSKDELEKINKYLPNLEKEAKEAEKNYILEKNKEETRNNLTVVIEKLKSDLGEYKNIELKEKELEEKQKEFAESENNLSEFQNKLKNLEDENKKNTEELNKLKDLSGEIEKNKTNIENNSKKQEELEKIQEKFKSYKKENNMLEIQKEKCIEADNSYKRMKQEAENIYEILRANKAGILAKDLKAGEKCPVCGSVEHPEIAKISDTKFGDEDLKSANKDRDDAQNISIQETNKLTEIKAKIENIENDLIEYSKKEFNSENLQDIENQIKLKTDKNKEEKELLYKEKETLENKQIEKEKLEKSVSDFESNKKNYEEKINKEKDIELNLKGVINSISATIEEKKRNLQFKTSKETKESLDSKAEELDKLKKSLDEADKLNNKLSKELYEVKGQKKELENRLKESKEVDVEKLLEELSTKTQTQEEIKASNKELYNRYKQNESILSRLKKLNKDYEKSSKELDMIDNLSRTANGALNGKQKITFENYILGTYFDEIIHSANLRFKDMTSYQFELRKTQSKGGNAQTGLDLDVFDFYTGKSREVSTLSGGESFKAALALSLGLSDIVQRQSGGVEIETMFIDEGFGSLDSESIEQTMKVLKELSANKTLIGIISHVKELKEQIDKKILVTKTRTGSRLSIELI